MLESVPVKKAWSVMFLTVMPGVIVERVGDDLMVIVPGNADVVSLSGRPAEVLLDVKAGRKVDSADPALRDLVDLGIVSAPGLSRRGLIKVGAVGAGAGIAVLAMPSVAAASSDSAPSDSIVASGLYQNNADDPSLVEFRLAISELGEAGSLDSQDLYISSLGITGQGRYIRGDFFFWNASEVGPALGTLTGSIDAYTIGIAFDEVPVTFTPGSFTIPAS